MDISVRKRGVVRVALFDSAGQMMTSEELPAGSIRQESLESSNWSWRSVQPMVESRRPKRRAADHLLRPHHSSARASLAVAAEQVHRALTIMAGPPITRATKLSRHSSRGL